MQIRLFFIAAQILLFFSNSLAFDGEDKAIFNGINSAVIIAENSTSSFSNAVPLQSVANEIISSNKTVTLQPAITQSTNFNIPETLPRKQISEKVNPPTNAETELKEALKSEEIELRKSESKIDLLGGTYLKSLNGNGGIISLVSLSPSSRPNVAEPLYLSEAVAFALKNNYEILASQSKVKGTWYTKLGAYSEFVPSVQVSGSTGSEYSAPAAVNDAYGHRILHSTHPLLERNLTIRQPLIDLNIIADILAAHNDEKISQEELRDTREGTAFDTASVFLKLIQSHIAVQLADQYKTYLDNLSSRMSVRLAGGGATKADLERIKGRETLADSAKIEAMGEYRSNLSEFIRLTRITPSKLQIPDILSPPLPNDVQIAIDHATAANPTYISSLRKVDAAVDERNKNVSGLIPKLSLQYSHNFTYDSGDSAFGNPVDGVYPDQTTNSLLLVASWTLNGGSSIAAGFSGVEKEKEMEYKSEDVHSRLEQAIRTSYEAVNAAHSRITVLQQAVKSDTRVVHDFEAQYKDGNRTLFDLLDAYEQLYNAKLGLMRLVVAEAQASLQIRRQMGDLVDAVRTVGEP